MRDIVLYKGYSPGEAGDVPCAGGQCDVSRFTVLGMLYCIREVCCSRVTHLCDEAGE